MIERKREREREGVQWKVIFYNTRAHSFCCSVTPIRAQYARAHVQANDDTMKDGSSTSFFPRLLPISLSLSRLPTMDEHSTLTARTVDVPAVAMENRGKGWDDTYSID